MMGAIVGAAILISGCSDNFTAPAPATGTTLSDVVADQDSLKAFLAALNKIGLYQNFDNLNSGQFTVFAPSNYAFVKYLRSIGVTIGPVTAATAGDMAATAIGNITYTSNFISIGGANGTKNLTSILTYHIISSAVPTNTITGAQGFTTMQGARLSLSNFAGATFPFEVNANVASSGGGSGSNIIIADKAAANGVVHVVDRVMLPITTANIWASALLNFSVNYATSPIVVSINGTAMPYSGTDINVATAFTNSVDGDFNLFTAALVRANLAPAIDPNVTLFPDFTVFAPTDAALKAYLNVVDEASGITAINGMTPAALAAIVKYHIVNGRVLSTDFVPAQAVTSWSTDTFTIDASLNILDKHNANLPPANQVLVAITGKDKLTNAGIVHAIGSVLQSN